MSLLKFNEVAKPVIKGSRTVVKGQISSLWGKHLKFPPLFLTVAAVHSYIEHDFSVLTGLKDFLNVLFFNQDRFMKQNQTTRIRPAVVLRVHCSVKCTLKILRRVYSACFLSSLGSQWPRLTNTQTAEMINGLIRGDDVLARIQFIIARSFLESF